MFHVAQYHFLQVIRKGPQNQYFNYALPQLVKISRFTGDDTELMRIVTKIPPDAYPRGAKSELFYLMGTRYYAKDELAKSGKYFGQVSPKSPLYLKAEYYRGVIFNQQGKLKSAVRSFRNVYKEEVDFYNDARALAEIEDIKSMALLNVARVYYGIERYDEAAKYYGLVDRDSQYWPEALFEHAWANFMQNNLNDTLGQLRGPPGFFNEDEFNPEATVLRARPTSTSASKKVEKLLLAENTYRPMQSEMRTSSTSTAPRGPQPPTRPGTRTSATTAVRTPPAQVPLQPGPPQQGARWAGPPPRHHDRGGGPHRPAEAPLARQHRPYLKKIIETDRQRYQRRAGLLFLKEMTRQSNKVAELLTQSEIIRFEVVTPSVSTTPTRRRTWTWATPPMTSISTSLPPWTSSTGRSTASSGKTNSATTSTPSRVPATDSISVGTRLYRQFRAAPPSSPW